jgi:hypothetical protein
LQILRLHGNVSSVLQQSIHVLLERTISESLAQVYHTIFAFSRHTHERVETARVKASSKMTSSPDLPKAHSGGSGSPSPLSQSQSVGDDVSSLEKNGDASSRRRRQRKNTASEISTESLLGGGSPQPGDSSVDGVCARAFECGGVFDSISIAGLLPSTSARKSRRQQISRELSRDDDSNREYSDTEPSPPSPLGVIRTRDRSATASELMPPNLLGDVATPIVEKRVAAVTTAKAALAAAAKGSVRKVRARSSKNCCRSRCYQQPSKVDMSLGLALQVPICVCARSQRCAQALDAVPSMVLIVSAASNELVHANAAFQERFISEPPAAVSDAPPPSPDAWAMRG